MKAIADEVSKGEYDLYLFQELWLEDDYKTIKERMLEDYEITKFWTLMHYPLNVDYNIVCRSVSFETMIIWWNSKIVMFAISEQVLIR